MPITRVSTPTDTSRNSSPASTRPAKWCAIAAISTLLSRARPGNSRPITMCPCWRTPPWSPRFAVAEWQDGKVEAWCPTQNPQAVQEAVAAALGVAQKDVTCHVTLLGGGFGRKSKPDYVVEAALLSKAAGKPVKVVWTREDDIRFDYYHSVAAMHMKGGLDASGRIQSWLFRSAFPPILSTFAAGADYGADFETGMALNE